MMAVSTAKNCANSFPTAAKKMIPKDWAFGQWAGMTHRNKTKSRKPNTAKMIVIKLSFYTHHSAP